MKGSIGDTRFYARTGPHSLAEVATAAGGTVSRDAHLMMAGVAPLQVAGPDEVSFLSGKRYVSALETTGAGAVIVHPDMIAHVPASTIPIVTKTMYESWARVAALFHPVCGTSPGIHPSACVSPDASVDPTAEIGPFAHVEAGAEIGPRCRVGAHASIGHAVVLGADCRIGTHVSISHALLGKRVCLHPGVRVGQEGFSFARTSAGYLTIPQLGRVVIEDDVEVGANSTIDRGSVQDTVIGAGSRLDNLVQIGHNVRLGRCCVIVAQVGISGSTVLDDFVQVGGQAAFAGHLHIGQGAQIGAQAGVISDVPPQAILLGSPAQSRHEFFRQVATLKRLGRRPGTDSKH
ncbi:MAG: UDP-3-O-(3-hydroxymyristoyl)glucosamine N-acyltransferase [Acidiphilium sp.]